MQNLRWFLNLDNSKYCKTRLLWPRWGRRSQGWRMCKRRKMVRLWGWKDWGGWLRSYRGRFRCCCGRGINQLQMRRFTHSSIHWNVPLVSCKLWITTCTLDCNKRCPSYRHYLSSYLRSRLMKAQQYNDYNN